MSVTYGFYNSLNGDRQYDATQISSMFDGLIIDGVFASIGTAFAVKATTGLTVNVGIGKAWFNHTWTLNDAILPLEAPISEVLLDRIDAVVLEVDSSESVRANSIKFIQGTPSSQPVRPTMASSETLHQYPLCYIYRAAESTEITQADITNMVGTEETPFITGILQTISLDELLGQWESELDQFITREQSDFTDWMNDEKTEYNAWFEQMKADLTAEKAYLDEWIASEQSDFLTWFNQMKGQLSTDAAGNLQQQIDNIVGNLQQQVDDALGNLQQEIDNMDKEEINRILLVGFVDGSKQFSDDGTVITSTASDGRTLVKTFTNSFLTMTNVLKSSSGTEIARMVKTFDSSGKLIDTVVTYS